MKVTLTTPGRFHTFALARELMKRDMLSSIVTGFPWAKVRREQLPRELVHCCPGLQMLRLLAGRAGLHRLEQAIFPAALKSVDEYACRFVQETDIYLALSGTGLASGRRAKEKGSIYICDRGSSHILFQRDILHDEYRRFGVRPLPFSNRIIERELEEYELADAITVPSEFVRQSFISRGINSSKIYKVPYGASISETMPQIARSKKHFDVLFVGGVSFRKGIPYLLESFHSFQHPSKRLTIVGARTSDHNYLASCCDFSNVTLLGPVPNEQVRKLMATCHVLVLPSIEEGLALVLAEALSCGCPVIASEHTGASDLLSDGVEGFIVPIRDVDAIRKSMARLADNSDLRERMSLAAHARVKELGGWSRYGSAMIDVFERVLQDRK